jgi:tetratricopeptide (TPR) repeat protein
MTPEDGRPNVVPFGRYHRRPDPARIREFADTARKLQREREESVDIVERILRETPRAEWPRLAENPALCNGGVLDRMSKQIGVWTESDPQRSLALAVVATTIADELPADAYPAVVMSQIRANAWKDRASALRYLGRYEESLDAIQRAEAVLSPFATVAHDRAIVRFLKATILQQIDRFDESEALLDACASVFFDHGDLKRYVYCGIARGNLLYRQHRYAAAREAYAMLLDAVRTTGDAESEARLLNNLGCCAIHLNDLPSADLHLSAASARFRELGHDVEAIRNEMSAGRLLIATGHVRLGIETLKAAREQFLAHRLVEEAGRCGLDVAGALLDMARESEARELTTRIAGEFENAGLSPHAVNAMGYLRKQFEAQIATRATVYHVRDYLDSLQSDPAREFVAIH